MGFFFCDPSLAGVEVRARLALAVGCVTTPADLLPLCAAVCVGLSGDSMPAVEAALGFGTFGLSLAGRDAPLAERLPSGVRLWLEGVVEAAAAALTFGAGVYAGVVDAAA